jgi:hypothetical protein
MAAGLQQILGYSGTFISRVGVLLFFSSLFLGEPCCMPQGPREATSLVSRGFRKQRIVGSAAKDSDRETGLMAKIWEGGREEGLIAWRRYALEGIQQVLPGLSLLQNPFRLCICGFTGRQRETEGDRQTTDGQVSLT